MVGRMLCALGFHRWRYFLSALPTAEKRRRGWLVEPQQCARCGALKGKRVQ